MGAKLYEPGAEGKAEAITAVSGVIRAATLCAGVLAIIEGKAALIRAHLIAFTVAAQDGRCTDPPFVVSELTQLGENLRELAGIMSEMTEHVGSGFVDNTKLPPDVFKGDK